MSYLLDTHIFLWFAAGDARLPAEAAAIVANDATEKWLSLASVWEMAIKANLGRLSMDRTFAEFINQGLMLTGCRLLQVKVDHLIELVSLSNHHRDRFDRLLVAQARVEELTLLTTDHEIKRYDVPTSW